MKKLSIVCAALLVSPCIALATPIPDTGQTKCYDNSQEMITCPSPGQPLFGQDAHYVCNPQSYTTLGGGIMVQDNVTGLIWEVKTDNDPPDIHDKDDSYTFYDAQDVFVTTLNSINFGGFSDWRLPTIKELTLIVHRGFYGPAINTDYFPNTMPSFYQSSTTYTIDTSAIWKVDFYSGHMNPYSKSDFAYVRAVRGNQFSNNFIDNGDGTVTDASTGLMWQKDGSTSRNWEDALSYCESLLLGGGSPASYDDWRLPDINELASLVDYGQNSPAVNTTYFPSTESSYYWSSSTCGYTADYQDGWAVKIDEGDVTDEAKINAHYIRAVRRGNSEDLDCDTILDNEDNCPEDYNPYQEDTYPPGGNECGDACECEADFDVSGNVAANDVTTFLDDYGRNYYNNPCINEDLCNGDFDCDGNVAANDVTKFLEDFGRNIFSNPCPLNCQTGPWCSY